MRGQDVLEETAHPVQGLEIHRRSLASFALAIVPAQAAIGQAWHGTIGGGGLEDVTGQVTQSVLARTGRLGAHVPMSFPNLGRHLGQQVGMFPGQALLEHRAKTIAQGFMMEEMVVARRDPATSIGTQAAAGNEVMNVRMTA